MDKKPTIDELEKILAEGNDKYRITILPDGSLEAVDTILEKQVEELKTKNERLLEALEYVVSNKWISTSWMIGIVKKAIADSTKGKES